MEQTWSVIKEAVGGKDIYVFQGGYDFRAYPKAAGFTWKRFPGNPGRKVWWTDDSAKAANLTKDPAKAVETHNKKIEAKNAATEASRATDASIKVDAPKGFKYFPFQLAGIWWIVSRACTLLADEMGLGKTIQVAGAINFDKTLRKILIMCPAHLKLNWLQELVRWLVVNLTIGITNGDSLPSTDVVIMNYELADRHAGWLRSVQWDMVVCDEAHFLKSPEAKRSQAVLGWWGRWDSSRKDFAIGKEPISGLNTRKRVYLTGTPIPNKPVEAFGILWSLGIFKNWWRFVNRYCGAIKTQYGWKFDGSSNEAELQRYLRETVMIRRLKIDVLKELPAKLRKVVELPKELISDLLGDDEAGAEEAFAKVAAVNSELKDLDPDTHEEEYKTAVAKLENLMELAFETMSKTRHAVAQRMLPSVLEHLENVLSTPGHKVVCFCHHRDIAKAIYAKFSDRAVLVIGGTTSANKHMSVDRFQNDPAVTLFVGNIIAAGTGLTLTAASHVVFAELDWVPGNVTQCEDRCHRIGQTDSVFVEHFVVEGSVQCRMAHILVSKQNVQDRILDIQGTPRETVAVPVNVPSKLTTVLGPEKRAEVLRQKAELTKDEKKELARLTITPAQIDAVHNAMRRLAGMCDGARELDGAGFNRWDVVFGHEMASKVSLTGPMAVACQRLVTKYRTQLGQEAVELAGGIWK